MTIATTTAEAPEEGRMFAADFDELQVGDRFRSAAHRIADRDVAVFAALTGDHHPIHVDPEWAARGPFGTQIAHGLLVLSCAVGSLPLEPERVLALRRLRDVVFKRPVAVGDSVAVSCRVTELKRIDEGTGLVTCEWRIEGEDGRLRTRALVEILWRRGPAGALEADEAERGEAAPESGGSDELAPVAVDEDGLQVLI